MEISYSKQAENFWNLIEKNYSLSWEDIEEEVPDEIDLQMLKEIENDPECHEFTKESDIDWLK